MYSANSFFFLYQKLLRPPQKKRNDPSGGLEPQVENYKYDCTHACKIKTNMSCRKGKLYFKLSLLNYSKRINYFKLSE